MSLTLKDVFNVNNLAVLGSLVVWISLIDVYSWYLKLLKIALFFSVPPQEQVLLNMTSFYSCEDWFLD